MMKTVEFHESILEKHPNIAFQSVGLLFRVVAKCVFQESPTYGTPPDESLGCSLEMRSADVAVSQLQRLTFAPPTDRHHD